MIKCELVVGGYSYRVTNDVRNWDDMVVSMKRADYDGVVRSFTSKFEFVNVAYSILKKQYRENYLEAAASVVISRRNNSWGWNEVFRCTLDFSTYNDDGMAISINAVDDSLANLIKAKRGTQYEYSVDVIKEEKQLLYDRLEARNTIEYIIGNERDENDRPIVGITTTASKYSGINLEFSIDEVSIGGFIDYGYDEDFAGKRYKTFARALKDIKIHFSVRLKTVLDMVDSTNFNGANVCLYKVLSSDGSFIGGPLFKGGYLYGKLTDPADDYIDMDIQMKSGEALTLLIESKYSQPYAYGKAVILENSNAIISFTNKGDNIQIDVVSPLKLLNLLLQSMNGGKEGLTGGIDYKWYPNLRMCVILAAESARGLKSAKLYSSYSKFCEWMSAVFGFVPVIGDNMVTFVHRDSLFSKEVVKTIDGISDFEYSTDSSMIYSRVRVGYEKQDYDSINGRDEFRFTNEYTSGINLTDNALELISPYRADAYGIEFLVQKRGEDTTDNSSDNNVFFVNATEAGKYYSLVRDISISGVISPETMFNVAYAPSFMINANKKFVGASVSKLTFASGDGNSDVVIGGVAESSDITISNRLFTAGATSIETADLSVPYDLSGLVSFEKNKEVYRGYIKSVGSNYGRDEAIKYVLIIESVYPAGVTKKVCTITAEDSFVLPIMYEKMVSDNPVSSDVIVKKYIVNEETGFVEGKSQDFIIPKGTTESEKSRTFITKPGYRTEYSLETNEDSECIYVLSI